MATSAYAETFKKLLPAYNPRHIEAYIRLKYPTLSGCSIGALLREANIAAACIDFVGEAFSEDLAVSMGL